MRYLTARRQFCDWPLSLRLLFGLTAVFYLGLQTLVVAHTAKWGEGEHSHHGEVCLLGKASARGDDVDVPVLVALSVPAVRFEPLPLQVFHAVSAAPRHPARARAPPAIQ